MRMGSTRFIPQLKWKKLSSGPSREAVQLSTALGVSPRTAQVCLNRGLASQKEIEQFLSPEMTSLHSPFLMKDMDKAVRRLQTAIEKGERILVCGDYDVDGITSTLLLLKTIRSLGGNVDYFVPDRIRDGYGFSKRALETANEKQVSLIVTVDCGVGSIEETYEAASMSIDVIVTDHHAVSGDIPPAYSVLNPRRPDCPYPFKELAGVGVAYKLCVALSESFRDEESLLSENLDILALGTIADLVPLTGENRVFARLGLGFLKEGRRKGIAALKEVSGIRKDELGWDDVGFALGPRINAAGRIGDSDTGLKLLLEEDYESALKLAQLLEAMNQARRKLDEEVLNETSLELEGKPVPSCIVLSSEGWHPGVIGVVASKLVDMFWRPSILISVTGEIGRGSARSVAGFDITKALASNRDILIGFGGHPRAAGFTIHRSHIPILKERMEDLARVTLRETDLAPLLETEMELPLSLCTDLLAEELERLAPFGPGNPVPFFEAHGCELVGKAMTGRKRTLKMAVKGDGVVKECVGFGLAPFASMLNVKGGRMSLAFTPVMNVWKGEKRVQLKLRDLRLEDNDW